MKAVRRYNPLWAGTGSGSAERVGVVASVEPASGQNGVVVVHGPGTSPLDQGQGRVSDLTLRPRNASKQGRRPLQNADIPPVTFPGGRNPYLDRPLPPPPSKSIAVVIGTASFNMPARPSTSSGPGSSKAAGTKPNLDKRLSKDDMALTGQTGTGKGRAPSPATHALWLLAPEPSPHKKRVPSPPAALSPPARILTPQSSASGEIQIGMALGSPTRDTTPLAGSPYVGSPQAGWQPQPSAQISHSPPPVQTPQPTVQRTKTQKRRLFGLFGSRKHAEPPKVAEAVEANRSTSSVAASVSNEDAAPVRRNTVAGKKVPKHKPIVVKSTPEPQPEITIQEASVPTISEPILSASPGGGGLLDIDIPDIRLERYSVMFSGVLNPNGTKSSLLERRQATLERLKTISDELENELVREGIRPRRATSPQPMKSPSFSLFPQTPSRQSGVIAASGAAMASTSSLAPPRGLTRSNTSPAYLPSPSRATFELPPQASPEQPRKEKKTVTIISPRAMDERNRAAQVEKLREQQQAHQRDQARSHLQPATSKTIFHFHQNESSLNLDSPDSDSSAFSSEAEDDHDRIIHRRPLPPSLKPSLSPEPQWQIITPPSSTSTSTTSSTASSADSASTSTTISTPPTTTTTTTTNKTKTKKRSPSTTSSSSAISRPSLDTAQTRVSVDEEDAALKAAVEISIARQISISRQQRRLLRPFGQGGVTMSSSGGTSARMGTGAGTGPGRGRSATVGGAGGGAGAGGGGGGGGVGRASMIQEEEFTVGVIKGRVTTPVMVGGGRGDHRRSERVVLDVA